jgi:prepilin-type N-terminal cleavage/methylation domain-containing protein
MPNAECRLQNQDGDIGKRSSAFILHSAFCSLPFRRRRAFTAIELLVAIFVLVVLASILVPYITTLRESARRTQCEANLQQIRDALHHYAAANKFQYPRVVYDAQAMPNSYTCFTGPDASNPFASGSAVKPNDVTASLWLLVREGLVRDTKVFVCPSAGGWRDPLTDGSGRFVKPDQRGNFREAGNLSYGYSSPFSAAPRYRMDDTREGDFAIMADKGPGFPAAGPVAGPPQNAPPLQQAALNSQNHDRAGQNVLYADGSIRWERSAYCGVGLSPGMGGDNIYTALTPVPLNGQTPPANGTGYWGPNIGPAWESDSYLVPQTGEGPP